MAKKKRVPEVLWRIFHNRARTLADTITFLIPPSPPSATACRCEGRKCLACSGDAAMSFLLRLEDPPEYRKLLTRCFVVVSGDAQPLSAFYPERWWSQDEIVHRTIEMIISKQGSSSNVICNEYDKLRRRSPALELLTCSAWRFLLERVGDELMVYLLKYTSIFLPLTHKKHYQVAGFPASEFCFKPKNMSDPSPGSRKKRKRVNEANLLSEKKHSKGAMGDDVQLSSLCGHAHNTTQKCLCRETMFRPGTADAKIEEHGNEADQHSSNQLMEKPRKRRRQFSWQRQRKRRQFDIQETNLLTKCKRNGNGRDSSDGRLQSAHNTNMPLLCSCCLLLQNLQYVTREAQIDRWSMFFSLESSSSVFPRKHVLNSLKPNLSGANILFKNIFGLSDSPSKPCSHSSTCLTGDTCLYHSLLKLLKSLIRKARNCQHVRLMEKHCPIPPSDKSAEGRASSISEGKESQTNSPGKGQARVQQDGKLPPDTFSCFSTNICENTPVEISDDEHEPSQSYCLKKHVVSFIWAVCRSVVPPDLLGTVYNWRILTRNIARFVRLRRFEKFSLKQCMHKLKTSMFPLLSNEHPSCYLNNDGRKSTKVLCEVKFKIVQNWMVWFFSCLVLPLVQANFYVTESEHAKQELFYYRKSIWENVMKKAITILFSEVNLEDRNYHLLTDAKVRKITSARSFGFSRIRLLPKGNGVRPLANLQAASRIPVKEQSLNGQPRGMLGKVSLRAKHVRYPIKQSVNDVLRDLHAVLKGLQMKEPEKLGSSVFDYNDVYRKLCPFLSVLKNGFNTMPPIFIVVSDVSKAFDSIDQDKLLSVMNGTIQNDEYLLKQSHKIVCAKKSLWVKQNLILADQEVIIDSNCSLDGVLVNQGWSKRIGKEALFLNLYELVKRNVLQFKNDFYLQGVGIPQGSVVSPLLCSFYFGHLEANVIFPYLRRSAKLANEEYDSSPAKQTSEAGMIPSSPKSILLRFVDDFIFISTSKNQAAAFFTRIKRGFRDYNCYMNKAKFGLNFDVAQRSGLASNRVYVGEDGIQFLRWSGLFINCCTAEVQADYTRYLNTYLSSTLTVCWQGKPGRQLKAKLRDYLRPKCHPIFYDSNINSAAVARLNIYQVFLLCAMKFHCYVRDLSSICKLDMKSYIGDIEKSLRYMHKMITRRMHSVGLGSTFRPNFQVERGEVEWLGLVAYARVLKRKQSRHKELLALLRSKLIAHEAAKSVSSVLKYVVDDSHSSVLWKIRY